MNWITAESQRAILEGLDGSAVFDLGIEYFFGMPSWAAAHDPKYEIWMTHTPQGSVNDNLSGAGPEVHEKYSYCGDSIHMYIRSGTHLDTGLDVGQKPAICCQFVSYAETYRNCGPALLILRDSGQRMVFGHCANRFFDGVRASLRRSQL